MRWVALVVGCVACASGSEGTDDTDARDTDVAVSSGCVAPSVAYSSGPPALRFLAVDNAKMSLLLVDELGDEGWEVPTGPLPRDLCLLSTGEVWVSNTYGAKRVSLASGEVTGTIEGYVGVQSVRALPGGHLLLGAQAGADVALIEVDATGAELSRVTVAGSAELRLVRRLDDGHTLLTAETPNRVDEVDATGAVVWTAALPGKGYVAERQPSGQTLATTGGDARLVDLDATGKITRSWGGKDSFPELGLDWFSGFQVLHDEIAVSTNWLGHLDVKTGPHVVAFSGTNELLWSWEDHEAATQVTNVMVLDARGL